MNIAPSYSRVAEPAVPARWDLVEHPREAPTVPAAAKKVWRPTDVLLVGVVAALAFAAAIVALGQVRHVLMRNRLADEMVTAATCFQTYLREQGKLPPSANAGDLPEGMDTLLAELRWKSPTPAGGLYRWTNMTVEAAGEAPAPAGTIALTAFPPARELRLSLADLQAMDRRIDDGDLATGAFRAGFNGWPVLRVSPVH